jgi:hypothetical protein
VVVEVQSRTLAWQCRGSRGDPLGSGPLPLPTARAAVFFSPGFSLGSQLGYWAYITHKGDQVNNCELLSKDEVRELVRDSMIFLLREQLAQFDDDED